MEMWFNYGREELHSWCWLLSEEIKASMEFLFRTLDGLFGLRAITCI